MAREVCSSQLLQSAIADLDIVWHIKFVDCDEVVKRELVLFPYGHVYFSSSRATATTPPPPPPPPGAQAGWCG